MPRTDRLGITVSLVMVGLALSILVRLPTREIPLLVLGSDLTLHFTGPIQLAVLMIALVCAGVDAIVRAHPQIYRRSLLYTVTFWVLPSLLVLASLVILGSLDWWGYQIALVGLTGALLTVVIVSQYRSIDPTDRRRHAVRLTLNALVYGAALVLFIALYGSRQRSVVSATGVLVASGLFALELLRGAEDNPWRIWFYAGLAGLLMGELTWALNYLGVDARIGGTFLLLVFYTITGLIQQYLWGRLTRRVLLEFGLVCALGLAVLTGFIRWSPR